MSTPILVAFLVGMACFALVAGIYFSLRASGDARRRLVGRRLDEVQGNLEETAVSRKMQLLRDDRLSGSDRIDGILRGIPRIVEFQQLINSAGYHIRVGRVLGYVLLGAMFMTLLSLLFEWSLMPSIVALFVPLTLAVLWFRARASARQEKILSQLPESLDLIARSVRAGYAFAGGFQMVAEEMRDPIAMEFRRALEERNFGASLREVMENLATRIDLMEAKLFATAVLVQAESGGNLAEVLDNLAEMIRERFRLKGKIRTLSAEGRLSAVLLIALPCLLLAWLTLANPDYLRPIFEWQYGAALIGGTVFWVLVGVVWIWRIVQIKF